ncbi:MAG TPA: hypothetical protein VN902_10450 [Candidatus Acidoferrales bacterium]|nr:hypothetical protein [Candidatus Acidoferrales bacterium]
MPVTEAKRSNQTVDRLANGASAPAEVPEISGGFDGQFLATSFENLELTKFAQHSRKCIVIADTLKSLAENQVRQSKTLPTELAIKVIGLFIPQAAQIVDPNCGINDDHRSLLCKSRDTRLVEISIPMDLASKPANGGLRPSLNQKAQCFLDCGPLCP